MNGWIMLGCSELFLRCRSKSTTTKKQALKNSEDLENPPQPILIVTSQTYLQQIFNTRLLSLPRFNRCFLSGCHIILILAFTWSAGFYCWALHRCGLSSGSHGRCFSSHRACCGPRLLGCGPHRLGRRADQVTLVQCDCRVHLRQYQSWIWVFDETNSMFVIMIHR